MNFIEIDRSGQFNIFLIIFSSFFNIWNQNEQSQPGLELDSLIPFTVLLTVAPFAQHYNKIMCFYFLPAILTSTRNFCFPVLSKVSILVPTLFWLYINDQPKNLFRSIANIYANDAKVYKCISKILDVFLQSWINLQTNILNSLPERK